MNSEIQNNEGWEIDQNDFHLYFRKVIEIFLFFLTSLIMLYFLKNRDIFQHSFSLLSHSIGKKSMALLGIDLNHNMFFHSQCWGTLNIKNLIFNFSTIFMLFIVCPILLLNLHISVKVFQLWDWKDSTSLITAILFIRIIIKDYHKNIKVWIFLI